MLSIIKPKKTTGENPNKNETNNVPSKKENNVVDEKIQSIMSEIDKIVEDIDQKNEQSTTTDEQSTTTDELKTKTVAKLNILRDLLPEPVPEPVSEPVTEPRKKSLLGFKLPNFNLFKPKQNTIEEDIKDINKQIDIVINNAKINLENEKTTEYKSRIKDSLNTLKSFLYSISEQNTNGGKRQTKRSRKTSRRRSIRKRRTSRK